MIHVALADTSLMLASLVNPGERFWISKGNRALCLPLATLLLLLLLLLTGGRPDAFWVIRVRE